MELYLQLLNFVVGPSCCRYNSTHMIRALLLIFDPSRTWEAIKNEQHSVGRISVSFFIPILLLASVGEGLGLINLGVEKGAIVERLIKPPLELVLRYEVVQAVLTLLVVYGGAAALKAIGASFHRRHAYTECFTTLAYSISPLLLLRILDGVPAMHTWACYGIGIFLSLTLLYRAIPFIMRPDPSSALGLFLFCSFLLVGGTALAHFVATQVLEERILTYSPLIK